MDSDAMDTSSEVSDYGSRLCALCSGITAKSLTSADGYRHAEYLGTISGGQGSCSLCNQMWNQIQRTDNDTGEILVTGKEQVFKDVRLTARPVASSRDSLTRQGHSLIISFEADGETKSQVFLELEVWCSVGDPAASLGIPELNFGPIDTRSEETFDFIRTCLNECRTHDCKEPLLPHNARTTPSRLVDLNNVVLRPRSASAQGGGVAGSVRLVDVTSNTCPRYAALSHCWGSNLEDYRTTSTNIRQRQLGLDVQTLSPTFKDVIEICCRLDIRFIWIDALCIVQDSAEEWNSESVIMGDIYQNAFFTISASHASDGLGGCFSNDCGTRSDEDLSTIANTDPETGRETSVLIRNKKTGYVPAQDLDESPLSKRGWVYQERFLSSRIIHFAATQVIWECRSMLLQQRLHPFTAPTVPSQAKLNPTASTEEAVRHWYRRVEDYSAREFTKYEDRLVALAGVAQICSPRINSRYIAGLWSSYFAYGLAWARTQFDRSRPIKKPRYPTWSWASHNCTLSWPGRDVIGFTIDNAIESAGFVLEDVALNLHQTPRGEFSPVKGGSITVRGHAAPVTHIDAGSITFGGHVDLRLGDLTGTFRPDEPEKLTELSMSTPDVLALALGWERGWRNVILLIIKPADTRPGLYVRVGLGRASSESAESAPFGQEYASRIFTII